MRGRAAAWALAAALVPAAGCQDRVPQEVPMKEQDRQQERTRMVEEQLVYRGIRDGPVVAAMRRVPRHRFVPPSEAASAYDDSALPIGEGQTISQPFVVAFMTQALQLTGREKVLEVGTGSGYMAALLGARCDHVYTVEIEPALATRARENLQRQDADNVTVIEGDGAQGWPAQAPYDAIVLSGSVAEIPEVLQQQLKVGGRLLAVVGEAPLMQARLVTCVAEGQFQSVNLFETSIPRLRNVPERGKFVF